MIYGFIDMTSKALSISSLAIFFLLSACIKYNVNGTIPPGYIQADSANNRVLIWNQTGPPNNSQAPSVVLGQPDFVSNTANNSPSSAGGPAVTSAYSINNPNYVSFDGHHLFVVDQNNNRVLLWNSLPTYNQQPADVVLGQITFSGNQSNQGNVNPSATTLKLPQGVFTDGTHLIVSDPSNHRVLIWNSIPTVSGQPADVVVGQSSMTNAILGAPTRATLVTPITSYYDGTHLFVSEGTGAHRVVVWNSLPSINGQLADNVLGQIDFSHSVANQGFGNPTAQTLNSPHDIVFYNGKLIVADSSNNRILIWNSFPSNVNQAADSVLGQSDMSGMGSGTTAQSFNYPVGIYVDPNKFAVSDAHNNRVLIFNSFPYQNLQPADYVLGENDFISAGANGGGSVGPLGFSGPVGITSDWKVFGVQRPGGY